MQQRYSKILVAVDGSDHARLACEHSIGFALMGKVEYILLYCYGELPITVGGDARQEIVVACEEEAKAVISPYDAMFTEAGLTFTTMMRSGAPGRTIVKIAEEQQCDLIIMGSRGLSDFSGIVMGSVSHRVLQHSGVPVLIVR